MKVIFVILIFAVLVNCQSYEVSVVQTAEFTGDRLTQKPSIYFSSQTYNADFNLILDSTQNYQQILGFGGAFTEV